MDIRQMIMQMAAGRMQSNPLMQQVMQMKQQGMSSQQAMKQRKCTCEPLEYWAICNAMKSDFRRTAMKYGMDKPDFYFDLAMDWLEDKDAKDGKAMLYYEHIVDV